MRRALLASISFAALSGAAFGQAYTTPHVSNVDAPASVTLDGVTFTNQGLFGAGRLPASTRDFLGDSLGSFSGLAIDPLLAHDGERIFRHADRPAGSRLQ